MKRAVGLFFLLIALPAAVSAQQKWFDVVSPDTTVFIDFRVIPDSLMVTGALTWSFHAPTGMLRLTVDPPAEVLVSYRTYPITLPLPIIRTRGQWDGSENGDAPILIRRQDPLFGDNRLQKSGSFTRGIQIGSDRDLTLESGLQFDVSGYITDSIFITASLTDRSTPIQPDGTTQTLREFDQVYVRLTHPNASMQMGDIDVNLDGSHFARFSRRLQGVEVRSKTPAGSYTAAAAVMRGNFRTATLRVSDGIQGPYRLTGASDEPFVVVLAGTERVYLDGVLLRRGQDQDYVIDYGLGEISFTDRRLIRADHRIVVDYQYLSSSYSRSLIAAQATSPLLLDGRMSFGFSYIREADDIRFTESVGITEQEREVLRLAGDDRSLAVVSGADSVGFRLDADYVLYVKRDSLIGGIPTTIYEHRPGDPDGVFRVFFSRVESGTGSYRSMPSFANSVVYQFVGAGNGDFEPFRTLIAPQEQQLLSGYSSIALSANIALETEIMMSVLDKNRFSQRDNSDNVDYGWRTAAVFSGRLSGSAQHRYLGRNVSFFDRIRDVEFDDMWNVPLNSTGEEIVNDLDLTYSITERSNVRAFGGLLRRGVFESTRAGFSVNTAEPGYPALRADADRASSNYGLAARTDGDIRYPWHVTPVIRWDAEQLETVLDTRYVDLTPGILVDPIGWVNISVFRGHRVDEQKTSEQYLRTAESTTWEGDVTVDPGTWVRTQNRMVFRNRRFASDRTSGVLNETSRGITLRSDTDIDDPNRAFSVQLSHEVNTESRALLDETYLEVGPELGQYVWIDLNNDGVRQVDEFFPETTPNEGTYIKQFRPSEEVFPIVSVDSRVNWLIDPVHWFPGNAVLSQIRYRGSLDLREQNRTQTPSDIYLLRWSAFQNDSTTVNGRIRLTNHIDLFQRSSSWSMRLSSDVSRGKMQQVLGPETSTQHRYGMMSEYRFERVALVGMEAENAGRSVESRDASFRNMDIDGWMIAPYVRFWPTSAWQGHIRLSLQQKRDEAPAEPIDASAVRVKVESTARLWTSWNVFSGVEFRSITLSGNPSPLSEFELTEGAGIGRSVYWTMNVNVATSQQVRASLQYDGRTRQRGAPIQTVRMTMTAVF